MPLNSAELRASSITGLRTEGGSGIGGINKRLQIFPVLTLMSWNVDDFHLLPSCFARMNCSNLLSQDVLVCSEIKLKVLYDQ